MLAQVPVLLRKDLALAWRGRARLVATAAFGVVALLLFSFAAGPDSSLLRANAAGYLWLALVLSSTLALAESFRVEDENGALSGLLLVPADARAVFVSKAIANLGTVLVVAAALVPVAGVLYGAWPRLGWVPLGGVLAAGAAGITLPGTLYAALASRVRARDVLMPLLLFPLLVPCLVAAVKATSLVLLGDPMGQLGAWMQLQAAFVVVYGALGCVLLGEVVEG